MSDPAPSVLPSTQPLRLRGSAPGSAGSVMAGPIARRFSDAGQRHFLTAENSSCGGEVSSTAIAVVKGVERYQPQVGNASAKQGIQVVSSVIEPLDKGIQIRR